MGTPSVQELSQKIEALERTNQELTTKLETAEQKVTALEGQLAAEQPKTVELQGKLTASEQKVAELQAKLTAAEGQVTEMTGKVATANQERDEAKVEAAKTKEGAARHGATAPEKTDAGQAGAGGGKEISQLFGRAKVQAAFERDAAK